MKNFIKLLPLSVFCLLLCSFSEAPAGVTDPHSTELRPENFSFGGAYLLFAGKYGGEVTRKQINGQRELGVDGCAAGSRIFTFSLDITCAGKTKSYSAKSNTLTPDMLGALKNLTAGDCFQFRKIKAYLPNGRDVVEVGSKEFTVV